MNHASTSTTKTVRGWASSLACTGRLALVILSVSVGLILLASGAAQAAFTRPFLDQISRAANPSNTACSEAEVKAGPPCLSPSGEIAVDAANNVWIGNQNEKDLAEFSPAYAAQPNAFLKTLPVGADPSMAIANTTSGDFYVANQGANAGKSVEVLSPTGTHLESWGTFGTFTIAIDNSTEPLKDPSACGTLPLLPSEECFVYVFDAANSPSFLEKFSSKGTPVEFSDAKKCEAEKCGYIEGSAITAAPPSARCGALFSTDGEAEAIAVDSEGDIYIALSVCSQVLEYRPSGEFLRAINFDGEEVPRLEGAVGRPSGVAFDPVSDHLLVSAETDDSTNNVGEVDEFDAASGKFVSRITKTSAGAPLQAPFAMTVDSHGDVYVVDRDMQVVDVWGPGVYLPSVTLGGAGERRSASAVLNGSVNPEEQKLSQCQFQYVSEESFEKEGFAKASTGECAPAASAIPADKQEHAVKAEIGPLVSGTTYRYRLVASSEGALSGTAQTEPLGFTTPAPPVVVSSSAANVSSTFVDLHAQIDPHGAATTYRFEYLTAAAFAADGGSFSGVDAATSMPVSAEDIGSGGPTGGAVESVMQHVGPLAPSTTYYYRVVAQNAQGIAVEAVCEGKAGLDCTFATLPAAVPGLPDGRSYELVTPARKEGGSDMFAEPGGEGEYANSNSDGTPSESGEGFLLEAFSLFGSFPGGDHAMYVFHRDPAKGEWAYTSLLEPARGLQSAEDVVFDPADLSRVAFVDQIGSSISEAGARPTDLVGAPGGPYVELHEDAPIHEHFYGETAVVGGSRDLSHVVLQSLTASSCPGGENVTHGLVLCEWAGAYETLEDGEVKPELKLVNVNDEEEPVSKCGAQLGSDALGGTRQAVSGDGSRVFFVAPDPETSNQGAGCWVRASKDPQETPGGNAPQLYARIDGTSTLELSEPEPGVTEPGSKEPHERPVSYPTEFVGASENGQEVFFVTDSWLTANHPQVHDPELYECAIVEEVIDEESVLKCKLTRISAGQNHALSESEGAYVLGVQAVASEGGAVYFLAFGALAPGAPKLAVGEAHTAAPVNLYRYQTETAGTPAQTTYVATVPADSRSDQPTCANEAPCVEESWYTTPDGRYLLFASQAELTPNADNAGVRCYDFGQQFIYPYFCNVLYRYDAQASERHEQPIVCVSCDSHGVIPTGNALFSRSAPRESAAAPIRGMSDDGSYVFFDTPTPLVPQATNGSLNVYEWHEGTISLLGSGSEAGPSYFLGYSPYKTPSGETTEGGNVFIGTHHKLVTAATNKVGNIYDARICVAESPCIQPPPGETAQCEGSSCQAQPVEPLDATPTSLSFSGPGDVASETLPPAKTVTKKTAVKCKKGFVKKKDKCVKQAKPKKRAKAKRSSEKRRAK
jgi:hypothetical protein